MKKLTGARLVIGAANDAPDIEYITRFRAVDPVVLLTHGRRVYLVVPRLELGRARRCAGRTHVLTPQELGLRAGKRWGAGEWASKLLRHAGVRQVTVSPTFPHAAARRLAGQGVKLRVAPGPLFPERAVKKREEWRHIRESQQAAVIAMRTAIAMIADADVDRGGCLRQASGHLTSEDVRRNVARVLLEHDCWCRDTIVACGPCSADPHELGGGPLREGEPVVLDIFPQHLRHGYWGDLTRTVVKGVPCRDLRRMYVGVKAAQAAALSVVRPGVKCRTVHRAAARELERRGFETGMRDGEAVGFIHSTGHGVGLSIHEGPSVGPSDTRLRSGNVITIEPGLYYPDVGGVRIEDTILVTPSGWRYFVPCEKRFEV